MKSPASMLCTTSICTRLPFWDWSHFLGRNEEVKHKAANAPRRHFGFGLSEREHGNDIYSDEMTLYPMETVPGDKGSKYYIGNETKPPSCPFLVNLPIPRLRLFYRYPASQLRAVKKINTPAHCAYVAEFNLNDYPVTEADILSTGPHAWDSA